MYDLKFLELSLINDVPEAASGTLDSTRESWRIYQAEARLAFGLAIIPGWSFWMAENWIFSNLEAHLAVVGPSPTADDLILKLRDIKTKIHTLMAEHVGSDAEQQRTGIGRATDALQKFISLAEPSYIHSAFRGILDGMCVLSWAAVEVFLEDLLVRAIDTRGKFPVPKDKLYFKRRSAYQGAYKSSCIGLTDDPDQDVTDAIMADEFVALASIRHCIVHRLGKMDQKSFIDKDWKESPILQKRYPTPTDDSPLQLDGAFVRTLIDGAVNACFVLANKFDQWLRSRPT